MPDYPVWVGYYLTHLSGESVAPISMDHVKRTLFGWQRWPGDEHLYGWSDIDIIHALNACGFPIVEFGNVSRFRERTHRQRFDKREDAHLYVYVRKP